METHQRLRLLILHDPDMRIRLEMTGGLAFFPVLAAPITIDTNTLPISVASGLERCVAAAQFFTRPPQEIGSSGADTQLFVITIDDDREVRTLEFREPISDSSINDLITSIRSLRT